MYRGLCHVAGFFGGRGDGGIGVSFSWRVGVGGAVFVGTVDGRSLVGVGWSHLAAVMGKITTEWTIESTKEH